MWYGKLAYSAGTLNMQENPTTDKALESLMLQETSSLSVLLHAAPALTLRLKQLDELNACWHNVFRKIFGYRRSESVKDVIYGLGRVNFKYLLLLRYCVLLNFINVCILNQVYCMMCSGRL